MDRDFALIAVATALLLLAASAKRPMEWQDVASGTATSKLALPPARHQRPTVADDDADAMAGKRLPFVASHHLPAAYSVQHRPLTWVGSGAEAGELGGDGEEPARERLRPLYMGDGTTTSQKQASSLLNRSRKGQGQRTTTTWLDDTPGASEELPELLNLDEPWLENHCLVDRHDFSTGGHLYSQMLYHVNVCLLRWTERTSKGHWVLCPQPDDLDGAPCGYVIVPLRGLNGAECALAFRADNLYLAAFANGRNKWHVFKRYAHLIPTATVLDYGNDYKDLIGAEGDQAKMSIQLGGAVFLKATTEISQYSKEPGMPENYVKLALAAMAMGIPEARRFTPIHELIVKEWDQGTRLNEKFVEYLKNWELLSCSILVAEQRGVWGTDSDSKRLKKLNIATTEDEASNIVDVMLLPRRTSRYKCPYQ